MVEGDGRDAYLVSGECPKERVIVEPGRCPSPRDFQGMTPASDDSAGSAPAHEGAGASHQAIGPPSIWLSLAGLRPRSARFRFTR